jgi:hypothetical protein
MARDGLTKTGRDEVLALALAGGANLQDAANLAGMSRRTASRRVTDPAFVAKVRECRAAAFDAALGGLSSRLARAVERLGELVEDANGAVALGACRTLLSSAHDYREQVELEARMTAVEGQMAKEQGR